MIIDFHSHIAFHKLYPKKFLNGLFDDSNKAVSKDKVLSVIKSFLKDENGDKLIKQMNKAGVSKSVLLIIDHCNFIGKSDFTIEENYLFHKSILELYPDRFHVFAGVHPERKNYLDLLKIGVEQYGFTGIKLYPPFGYQLSDPRLDACFKYANEKGLPVLSHTGYSTNGLQNDYADPSYFLELSKKYPEITFIMAHAGYKLSDPTVSKLLGRPNVYADISGFLTGKEEDLALIFQKEFADKLLFGTDYPITGVFNSVQILVAKLDVLFKKYGAGDMEIWNKIMHDNAKNILGN